DIRQQALTGLQNVRGDPETTVPALAKLLKGDNKGVRQGVLQVLLQYGAKAIPHLIDAIQDPDQNIRQQATWALQNVQGDVKPALPMLTKLLKESDNANLRQAVVQVIGR